ELGVALAAGPDDREAPVVMRRRRGEPTGVGEPAVDDERLGGPAAVGGLRAREGRVAVELRDEQPVRREARQLAVAVLLVIHAVTGRDDDREGAPAVAQS